MYDWTIFSILCVIALTIWFGDADGEHPLLAVPFLLSGFIAVYVLFWRII